eukprot:g33751.t1
MGCELSKEKLEALTGSGRYSFASVTDIEFEEDPSETEGDLRSEGYDSDLPQGFQVCHDFKGFTVTPTLSATDDDKAAAAILNFSICVNSTQVLDRVSKRQKIEQIMSLIRRDVRAFAAARQRCVVQILGPSCAQRVYGTGISVPSTANRAVGLCIDGSVMGRRVHSLSKNMENMGSLQFVEPQFVFHWKLPAPNSFMCIPWNSKS